MRRRVILFNVDILHAAMLVVAQVRVVPLDVVKYSRCHILRRAKEGGSCGDFGSNILRSTLQPYQKQETEDEGG